MSSQGVALVSILFLTVFLMLIAVSAVGIATSQSRHSLRMERETFCRQAALAGIEEALYRFYQVKSREWESLKGAELFRGKPVGSNDCCYDVSVPAAKKNDSFTLLSSGYIVDGRGNRLAEKRIRVSLGKKTPKQYAAVGCGSGAGSVEIKGSSFIDGSVRSETSSGSMSNQVSIIWEAGSTVVGLAYKHPDTRINPPNPNFETIRPRNVLFIPPLSNPGPNFSTTSLILPDQGNHANIPRSDGFDTINIQDSTLSIFPTGQADNVVVTANRFSAVNSTITINGEFFIRAGKYETMSGVTFEGPATVDQESLLYLVNDGGDDVTLENIHCTGNINIICMGSNVIINGGDFSGIVFAREKVTIDSARLTAPTSQILTGDDRPGIVSWEEDY